MQTPQYRDGEHEPKRAEWQLARGAGQHGGARERPDVVQHVRRYADYGRADAGHHRARGRWGQPAAPRPPPARGWRRARSWTYLWSEPPPWPPIIIHIIAPIISMQPKSGSTKNAPLPVDSTSTSATMTSATHIQM